MIFNEKLLDINIYALYKFQPLAHLRPLNPGQQTYSKLASKSSIKLTSLYKELNKKINQEKETV